MMFQLHGVFYIVTFYSCTTILQSMSGEALKCQRCMTKNCTIEEEFCQNELNTQLRVGRDASVVCEIKDPRVQSLQCSGSPCQGPVKPSTKVTFVCPPNYQTDSTQSECLESGTWSDPISCTPECGINSVPMEVQPLILYGSETQSPAQWPWAAALHRRFGKGNFDLVCGGTLITDNAIITAAHCVWDAEPKDVLVVLGHLHRSLPEEEKANLINKVKRIYVLPVYKGAINSYNSDIAIMVLESRVQLSEDVRPACLPDPKVKVTNYTLAVIAGWGFDENLKKLDKLKYVQVPIVDTVKCLKHVPKSFTKYLAYSAFCAGYLNGTGVCNGDSGSGLLTEVDGRWTLQGIISISPRKGTANSCDPKNFSLYTKIIIYVDWIKNVLNFEENRIY